MFGGPGDDVNLWAPGDGSETFVGGPGLDAIIFGSTDREAVADPATGVRLPTLRFGNPGFPHEDTHGGREWSGKLLQVFAFANLTDPSPSFVAVSQQEVEILNSLVAGMIR